MDAANTNKLTNEDQFSVTVSSSQPLLSNKYLGAPPSLSYGRVVGRERESHRCFRIAIPFSFPLTHSLTHAHTIYFWIMNEMPDASTGSGSHSVLPLLTPSSEPIYASMVADAPELPVNLLQASTVGPLSVTGSPHEPPIGTLTSAGGLPPPPPSSASVLQALAGPFRPHSEPLFEMEGETVHSSEMLVDARLAMNPIVTALPAPAVLSAGSGPSALYSAPASSISPFPPRDEAGLRSSILEIQRNPLLSTTEKARQVQVISNSMLAMNKK